MAFCSYDTLLFSDPALVPGRRQTPLFNKKISNTMVPNLET
jgi:hypothetical protein